VIVVTRRETFAAGHRLHNPAWPDEKNREVFGRCSNPRGHGHNYVLEVTVTGDVDGTTGYVMDLGELSRVIHRTILDDIDHKNLNEDVDWLRGHNPTTEVLAGAFWERLETVLPPGALVSVRLQETDKNWAERRR
jgi:6-pyruvoyltetrahydropterin/6-carboxytetrahydropterin synthase